jgi:hypothetical protein
LVRLIFLFTLFLSFDCFADARQIRVYFLSRPDLKKTSLYPIEKGPQFSFSQMAQADSFKDVECEPFGEGCFHPQLGYIEDQKKVMDAIERKQQEVDVNTINAEEVNLITCDKEFYFDMYCGKAGKITKDQAQPSPFELWVDVSSSMRQVDFSQDDAYCERRRLVAKLKDSCSENIDVYTFNTSRKSLGMLENTCLNYGTNDGRRLVQWLKDTEAKQVVIITDVDEYTGEFREYLDLSNADIHGIGVKPIFAEDLYGFFDNLKKFCSK